VNVEFTAQALDDLRWFIQRDPRTAKRIVKLIEDVRRAPFDGLGKPEPLKGDLSGWWSRRIDGEHRLVYRVVEQGGVARVQVAQCRYHY
jgi:toxin YoeB